MFARSLNLIKKERLTVGKRRIVHYPLPIAHCLLPIAYCQLSIAFLLTIVIGCQTNTQTETATQYTCPMPEDSVFSDKPGKCPKCGMDLGPVSEVQKDEVHDDEIVHGYVCPMHPQVHSEEPGDCPICGMKLEKANPEGEPLSTSLGTLLKPVNQVVVAKVPMVHMAQREEEQELEVLGNVEFDPEFSRSISARVSGRITKIYVKYKFQSIRAGQPLMEIYSQDLVTAQDNYLFLLKNDANNQSLISAARQKLRLLGMADDQINQIGRSGKSKYSITVFSNVSGVISEGRRNNSDAMIPESSGSTLTLKEGMYVEKGSTIFQILNPAKARINLQIFPGHRELVKVGDRVRIQPEANPDEDFRATISQIVPFYNAQTQSLVARVSFDNSSKKLPAGSTVKAIVFAGNHNADWLPEEAVVSLGMDKVVFVREGDGFVARKVKTGIVSRHLIQILSGLKQNEAVAANAGFLVDSENFITTKNDEE